MNAVEDLDTSNLRGRWRTPASGEGDSRLTRRHRYPGPIGRRISIFQWLRLVVTETYESWRSHRTMRLGAGLAYYALFAVVPLFSISLAVAGLVIDQADVQKALESVLANLVDADVADFAASLSAGIDSSSTVSGLGLFGLVSLILTASLVFVALQDAFDTIWEIPVARGTRSTMRRRFLAFAVVFMAGALLIASFVVVSISNLVRGWLGGDHTLIDVVADILTALTSGAILAAVIALLFHFLTAQSIEWRVSTAGGVTTALVLTIGNRLFVAYMQRFGSSSLVGATGSILVGIVWLYSIAQIMLAGAELTRTLERRLPELLHGSDRHGPEPSGHPDPT